VKRRFKFILNFILPVLTILLLFVGGYVVLTGPFFKVNTIYIDAYPDIFSDVSLFKQPRNLLWLSLPQLQVDIGKRYPAVLTADIKKNYPRSLYIKITERTPVVIANIEQKIYYFAADGMVLPELSRYKNQSYPLIECQILNPAPGKIVREEAVLGAFKIVAALTANGFIKLNQLKCVSETDFSLLVDGVRVIFLPRSDAGKIVDSLQFLFKQFRIEGKRPETIDLRFAKPILNPVEGTGASQSTGSGSR